MPCRVLILRAPGTNCDHETAFAFERAGAEAERLHVQRLLERPDLLNSYQILCIPGGFSYGDDIAAGRIFANQLRYRLNDVLRQFHGQGKLILGICNGFQVLLKAGLIVPDSSQGPRTTLDWNDSGKYEDRWVELAVTGNKSIFLADLDRCELPVAHAEGKFVTDTPQTLTELENAGQLVLRYCGQPSATGEVAYPQNPNGSLANVAGLCDPSGRVLGMMPHPERFIDPLQHPRWTRRPASSDGDGLRLFRNAVQHCITTGL